MPYASWAAAESIIRSVTKQLENRRTNLGEAPASFRLAVAQLNDELSQWPSPENAPVESVK